MSDTIRKLTIEGFKSIRKLEDFELRSLNVLIGPNGAGKSNFVGFFRLLRELIEQGLQIALRTTEGGADACLYMGPKITKRISAKLIFGSNGYEFALVPTVGNELVFAEENTIFEGQFGTIRESLGSAHAEAKLKEVRDEAGKRGAKHGVPHYVYRAISSWVVYHFHDTGLMAGVRRQKPINDNETLRFDAENLAAFLYRIHQTNPDNYNQIRDVVRLAAPFFDDFKLRPVPANPNLIQLEWLQKNSDYPFLANQLSDGTLRFICLATALLQPARPSTVLFDEPELGLHPYALTLLGNLFKQSAEQYGSSVSKQVIISTQSAQLLNEFAPEDVIVVERHAGESTFRRLNSVDLSEWLQEYTLGDLWQKNVLGGRPRPESTPVPDGDGR
ncbi:MAG TPA: AAA family ATPase [Bryobacteraceae bacterium]|nr:AAA family ATPase [Bryobacteraceae bacterium]